MKQVSPQVVQRGIKVIANAGGINPRNCAAALKAVAVTMGLAPQIAVVAGNEVWEVEVMACIVPSSSFAAGDALARNIFEFANEELALYKPLGWIRLC
jgi:hypothetical protein